MPVINSKIFKKLHNINPNQPLSLEEIAHLSGMPFEALKEVFFKGQGAYFSNPSSVRPHVKSASEWAFARVYSFVMKRKSTYGKADKHIADKYNI